MLRRFVVLFHEHPDGDHWDFMLETEIALTTWAVPPQPLPFYSFECKVKRLSDHRRCYLDYEGVISNHRGCVRQLDSGTYETETKHETEIMEHFRLHGKLFNGILTIQQLENGFSMFFYQSFVAKIL
ncbi:MAG: hypothetical protein LBF88_04505 [Planctomycetaceae bacterium]|jgi:hypothetical protein|nr:hypothetical protein [Planctomycetaceae bacterium]